MNQIVRQAFLPFLDLSIRIFSPAFARFHAKSAGLYKAPEYIRRFTVIT